MEIKERSHKATQACHKIPKGSFWAKWSDVKNRDCYAQFPISTDSPTVS
jgi:hypothetical protein